MCRFNIAPLNQVLAPAVATTSGMVVAITGPEIQPLAAVLNQTDLHYIHLSSHLSFGRGE